MATQWDLNQTPLTGAIAVWQLIAKLIAAGWTQSNAGDGTSYPVTLTSGSAGANGLGNQYAWIRLTAPSMTFGGTASVRELLIQRGNSNREWWIRYSWGAGFTGTGNGALSGTVSPTATDQVNLLGTNSAGFWLFSGENTYRCHVMAYDASNSYGFYLVAYTTGLGDNIMTAFVFDPMDGASSADKDPFLWYVSNIGSPWFNQGASYDFGMDASPFRAFMSNTFTSANFAQVQAYYYGCFQYSATVVPAYMPVDSFGGVDHVWPIFFGRRSTLGAPNGPKGWGRIMHYTGVPRATGDTLSIGGSKDWLILRSCAIPWDNAAGAPLV